jgi:uncharacterized membrane protein
MSDQDGEASQGDQEPNHAKVVIAGLIRSPVVVTALSWTGILGLVGLLSDTAQIFSTIDSQPQSIIAIVLLVLLIACVPTFLFTVKKKTKVNTTIFAVIFASLVVSMIFLGPSCASCRSGPQTSTARVSESINGRAPRLTTWKLRHTT